MNKQQAVALANLINDFTLAPDYTLRVTEVTAGHFKVVFKTTESRFSCFIDVDGNVNHKVETRTFEGW